VPAGPWLDEDDDLGSLPCYVSDLEPPPEPPPRPEANQRRDPLDAAVVGFASASEGVEASAAPRRHELTTFLHLLLLSGPSLAGAVEAWWARESRDDVVDVRHHLRLAHPEFCPELCGGWRMDGCLHRRTALRLPMTLELSPRLSYGTLVHLRPERPIHGSRGYFRTGHAVVQDVMVGLLRSAI
jgi:hypothetical protein